jgi:hypothetical protein
MATRTFAMYYNSAWSSTNNSIGARKIQLQLLLSIGLHLFLLTRVLHLLGWGGQYQTRQTSPLATALAHGTRRRTASALRTHVLLQPRHLTRLGRMTLPPDIYHAAHPPATRAPARLAARSFGSVAARQGMGAGKWRWTPRPSASTSGSAGSARCAAS